MHEPDVVKYGLYRRSAMRAYAVAPVVGRREFLCVCVCVCVRSCMFACARVHICVQTGCQEDEGVQLGYGMHSNVDLALWCVAAGVGCVRTWLKKLFMVAC
jgi:hypothetical protein